MDPRAEASAILNHYFAALARRAGHSWTERNAADIDRATALLADDAGDTIPPYQPAAPPQLDSRVTRVLERERASADDLNDPNYQQWRERREQRQQEDQTRRLVQREVGRR